MTGSAASKPPHSRSWGRTSFQSQETFPPGWGPGPPLQLCSVGDSLVAGSPSQTSGAVLGTVGPEDPCGCVPSRGRGASGELLLRRDFVFREEGRAEVVSSSRVGLLSSLSLPGQGAQGGPGRGPSPLPPLLCLCAGSAQHSLCVVDPQETCCALDLTTVSRKPFSLGDPSDRPAGGREG